MSEIVFSFFISTYNRIDEIKYSLSQMESFLKRSDVECLICDDASTDDTYNYIKNTYPNVRLFRNETHKGYIYSRNFLLRQVKGKYAISVDDDLNFISENVLETIEDYFEKHTNCGAQGFRVFWGKLEPISKNTKQKAMQVKSFVGCAHAFRMSAWKDIPEYPEWFVFYGEENYASYHFFLKNWQIHYVPEVLGHHRVDMKARKQETRDYIVRQRNSLRAGWYLFFIFLPIPIAFRYLFYSIWSQLKNHVFKGQFVVVLVLLLAFMDLLRHIPKIIKEQSRLTKEEYLNYKKLKPIPVYWAPEEITIK